MNNFLEVFSDATIMGRKPFSELISPNIYVEYMELFLPEDVDRIPFIYKNIYIVHDKH